MLTAGDSAAETAAPNSDENDDSFPPIEEILYRALQRRGLGVVGEDHSTANAGRGEGEEAFSAQRDNAICNGALTPGNSVGNTQGELYTVPQYTEERPSSSLLT
jgi:hypothetical protein